MPKKKGKLVKTAEWLEGLPTWFSGRGPIVVSILIVIACIIICLFVVFRDRGDAALMREMIDESQAEIMESVKRGREEDAAEMEALQSKFYESELRIQEIDARIEEGAAERDEAHEEISNASTIGGVNAVLKRRKITGGGTTRQTAANDLADTGRIDANPF